MSEPEDVSSASVNTGVAPKNGAGAAPKISGISGTISNREVEGLATHPVSSRAMLPLQSLFGPIDIYLFDQLLRGRIVPGMCIFDAGCGAGRNLVYFLREGYEVFGVDANPDAIASVRALAASLARTLPTGNFRMETLESTSFQKECA